MDIENIPFPLSPKDGFIKDFLEFAAPLTEAPKQFHMAAALCCIAGLCKRNVYMKWGIGNLYPNIYLLVVGKSGMTHKSSAIKPATILLNKISRDLLLYDLTSTEFFLQTMQENPHRIAIYDEFKILMDNANKTYGVGLIPFYTRAWDCPSFIDVGFKNIPKEKRRIENPCITILSATTTDWIEMRQADIEGGFFGRFLTILATNEGRIIPIPKTADESDIEQLTECLKGISAVRGEFVFSDKAKEYYKAVYVEHKDEFVKEQNKDLLTAFYSRIDVHIIKLAMIFQISSDPGNMVLTEENIRSAHITMEYIKEAYKHLLTTKIHFTKQAKMKEKVLRIIENNQGIPYSRLLRNSHLYAEDLRPIIETLKSEERIKEHEGLFFTYIPNEPFIVVCK